MKITRRTAKKSLIVLSKTIVFAAFLNGIAQAEPVFKANENRDSVKLFGKDKINSSRKCVKSTKLLVETKAVNQTATKPTNDDLTKSTPPIKPKFHWKPALRESFRFLAVQHIYRMKQERTRVELDGKFFRDWVKSIRGLQGWRDSDGFFINWIAHPLQGGATGRIFVNNSDRARIQQFGKSSEYWRSRFKAMIWSAAWSTQFELGPLSEASIGNVGIRKKRGRSTMAWIDLVTTPTLGTGVLIGEDAIDKYVLKNWLERKTAGRTTTKIKLWRSLLTPTTSFANILRGKLPWKRDARR
jgi:hypothetical protein